MPQLVIKVSSSLANSLQRSVDGLAGELVRLVRKSGGEIGSPTGSVGEAARYFTIENLPSENAEQLILQLQQLPGVEAAYIKPADELP